MPFPCNIINFLQPNLYHWNLHVNRQTMYRSKRKIVAIDMNNELLQEIQNTPFLTNWLLFDEIEILTNLDLITTICKNVWLKKNPIIREFLSGMTLEEAHINNLFPLFFEILFKPSEQVSNTVDSILAIANKANSSFLCLHIRKGQNPTNPKDILFNDRKTVTKDIIRFIDNSVLLKKHNLTILVASDSDRAVSQVLRHFPNRSLTISGPILHIDRPVNSANHCEGFLKVLVEFYLLGECHTSILTNSGFSAFANLRRMNPYQNLYKYDSIEKQVRHCDNILLSSKWEPSQNSEIKLYCTTTYDYSVAEVK